MSVLLRITIGLVAGVLGVGALVAPAHAEATISVSSGTGVLYTECTDHPINYSVTLPTNVYSWNVKLVYQAPDGTSAGSGFISSSDPTTGVEMEQFCAGSDLPGTYNVTGTFEVMTRTGLTNFQTTRMDITPFTFDMRLAEVRTTAKASTKKVKRGKKVRVTVKVTDERPSGGFFGSNAEVQIQRKKGSKWVGVKGAKGWTKGNGKAKLAFKHTWKGKTQFRAVADVDHLGRSTSSVFKVRGR